MTAECAWTLFWKTGLAQAYTLYCLLREEEVSRAEKSA